MNPPLPTASNFPFHLAAGGSQSSKLMCESLVGAEKATTRHKGTETSRLAPGPAGPAGTGIIRSGGGAIGVAEVIVAFGISRDVKLSQACWAATRLGANAIPASKITTGNETRRCLMRMSSETGEIEFLACDVYTPLGVARKGVSELARRAKRSHSTQLRIKLIVWAEGASGSRGKMQRTANREWNRRRRSSCARRDRGKCGRRFPKRAAR